jgi:tetratricopeptide (TPR) repeat protein
MKKLSSTLLLFFISIVTIACLNEYRTKLDGSSYETMTRSGRVWVKELDTTAIRIDANELWKKYTKTDSIAFLSDYAAQLVYLGEYEKAKAIYFNIEASTPDLYTTASNLGTIYELVGMPDSATTWIRKSVDINPNSHGGSEWIHLKILTFKLSESKDYSASILGLDFGRETIPKNINNIELQKLSDHIYHQLEERLQFVKPENKIVGNLYFDLGNILALSANLEAALESYAEATAFGFKSQLMDLRIAEFESMTSSTKTKTAVVGFVKDNKKVVFIAVIVSIILFPILLFWAIRRYRKGKKKRTSNRFESKPSD